MFFQPMSFKLKEITVLVTAAGAQFMPGLVNCLKDNGERNIRIVGTDMGEDRTFKVSRILSVNGHSFSRIFWQQIGDDFKRIY